MERYVTSQIFDSCSSHVREMFEGNPNQVYRWLMGKLTKRKCDKEVLGELYMVVNAISDMSKRAINALSDIG